MKVFRSSDLSLKPIDSAEISNCQHVASYNWLNDEVPTIVVPGKASFCAYMDVSPPTLHVFILL